MRTETTFHLVGDLIGVDAVMVGPAGSAEVTLILDTAAAMWSITRTAAADERGYIVR